MKIRQREVDLLLWLQRGRVRYDGRVAISLRITTSTGKYCELSTSIFILPENWDVKNKSILKTETNARQLNSKLSSLLVDIKRIHDKLCLQSDEVSPQEVKTVYKGEDLPVNQSVQNTPILTFVAAFDEYIVKFSRLVEKKERSEGTLRQWKSTRKKVVEFLQFEYKDTDILFQQIMPDFADQMYDYLTIEVAEPLCEATAKKHIKKIKQIIKTGVKKLIIPSNPIEDYKCGGDQKDIPPLEFDEVLSIFSKDFGIERLNEVRDAYVFQIFTGFAFQDIFKLSPENIIQVGIKKERWLAKHRGKTGVYEIVPMLPFIEQLIDRYKDHPKCIIRNALMPINSNTKYNGYLKEIADICGIKRNLNTHLARHTFADIMLNLGMPLEDVSKMLGHKSIRTTQRYCRISKERIQKNFNEFVRPALTLNGVMNIISDSEKAISVEYDNKISFAYSSPTSSSNSNFSINYSG